MVTIDYNGYSNKYTAKVLIGKLKKNTLKAGHKLIYTALLLYYTLQKENVPLKAKGIIIGALGYFIAPFDALPDLLPMLGYTDDFGALMMALAVVSMYIDDGVKHKAHRQFESWFGQGRQNDINEINGKL